MGHYVPFYFGGIMRIANTTYNDTNKPGIYLLLDEKDRPLYIGKAYNLTGRIKTHWRNIKKVYFR